MAWKIPLLILACGSLMITSETMTHAGQPPIPVIFDTDMGNDCDDVQALAMIHALQTRGECQLLAVTITKDHDLAAPFTDCLNTFYGRSEIPIGVCHSGVTNDEGRFNGLANIQDNGQPRYPHDLLTGKDAVDAVTLLRKTLSSADDASVVICQVGFSTNMANLLESPADDISPLSGLDLVRQKVKLLSVMGGAFIEIPDRSGKPKRYGEYNLIKDLPSAQKLAAKWPTPIVWSGYEIGLNLTYPYRSIERDYNYVPHHPVVEAYNLFAPPPHDRPTWDLTSVLYALRPDDGYFDLSPPGQVTINNEGHTEFKPTETGGDRYLILRPDQKPRVLEALMLLSSEPPAVIKTPAPPAS
jgi:inosine-uridine nucleoside N-ribohydrolase